VDGSGKAVGAGFGLQVVRTLVKLGDDLSLTFKPQLCYALE